MSKLNTFKKLWSQDKHQVFVAAYNNIVHTGITNLLSDKAYLKLTYLIRFREKLDFDNPVTFNQKIQWLKLYDRQERYTELVDKVKVKEYVANMIGSQYVIPTLGVYDSFDEIDFEDLPNQFVLKCNHDSGSIVICRDKSTFDKEHARKKLTKGLKTDAYYWGREWPYKNVKPQIIAEKYMEDTATRELRDYKFFCFNGQARCFKVDFDRFKSHHANYFDTHGNLIKIGEEICPPNFDKAIEIPCNLDKMKQLAEKLTANIPFLRADFYDVNSNIYFGELTFFPASGFGKFIFEGNDEMLGKWLKLPNEIGGGMCANS